MHYCAYHKKEEPEEGFRVKPNGKLDSWCIEGRREYNRRYSREAYAPIKAKVAQRRADREANPATERVCIDCHLTLPIAAFPLRGDRPGDRHTRCTNCFQAITQERNQTYNALNREKIAIYKKEYHAANPGYNRGSSRRRRAAIMQNRTSPYTREEIWGRDNGLCSICGEEIDLALVFPDPLSCTVDHHHPVSKRGPDVPGNVGVAHYRCNRAKWDGYTCPFAAWTVEPVATEVASQFVGGSDVQDCTPELEFVFALLRPNAPAPSGRVAFGVPGSSELNRSACPEQPTLVTEVKSLWIEDRAPFGAASWFVSRALRALPPFIVVTVVDQTRKDPRDGRCHDGTVFRALSFDYAGGTTSSSDASVPDDRARTRPQSASVYEQPPLLRYWTVSGDQRSRRLMRELCAWPSISYPPRQPDRDAGNGVSWRSEVQNI